jgi:Na+-translocating ferredoxin:NAD+ oxidoreductase RnfG subunit
LVGLYSFIVRRSITLVIVLAVVIALTAGILYYGVCARIDSTVAEIRQQIYQEIAEKKITFPTQEAEDAYVDARMQEELVKRGLDICV